MGIQKVIFKGLTATSVAYTAIGGIRFYDGANTVIPSGAVITNTQLAGETDQFKITATSSYHSAYYYPVNTIDTAKTQTGTYTDYCYWLDTNDNQTLTIEFKTIANAISKIEFNPRPDTTTDRAVDASFTIEVYDEVGVLIKSYSVTPSTTNNTVQVLSTPELNIVNKFLIEDGTDIKKWDATLATPAWTVVGTAPATKAMFDTDGMSDLSIINNTAIQALVSATPKLLCWTSEVNASRTANTTAVPKPILVLPTGDIDLFGVANIDSFTVTANQGGAGIVRLITSVDKGTTWYAYDSSLATPAWVSVNTSDLADVKAKGLSPTNFNAVASSAWMSLLGTSRTIRFAYYLEQSASTDVANTDTLATQWDMNGKWKGAIHGTDYDFEYPYNSMLRVNILANGTYKVNY